MHEVTQAFAAASREVLAVEAELAGPRAQPLLAGHVRSLQQLEQTRLATVRPCPTPYSKRNLSLGGLLGPLWATWSKGQMIPVPVPGVPDPPHLNLPLRLHLRFSDLLVSTCPQGFIPGF